MLKSFFKSTFRGLWKNKTYSFLNIFGLAVGIACAGLIFLWVEDEMNYDSVNVKKDNLYQARVNWPYAGNVLTIESTQGLLGPAIKKEIPGIVNTCRVSEQSSYLFDIGNTKLYSTGRYAEASMFSMFTMPFVQGNAKAAFSQPYSLVITEKAAKKYFGSNSNVIGRTIKVDNRDIYTITGVIKDFPQNSTLQFEWVAPFEIFAKERPQSVDNWGNMSVLAFAELGKAANLNTINKQLYNFVKEHTTEENDTHAFLFSMNEWRLHNDFTNGKPTGKGRIENVRTLSIIAWVILIIACINFMNLATARSEKKAREVGVKKVLGARKKNLVFQFIGEALCMSFLAATLSFLIILVALPAYNTLVEKELSLFSGLPVHIAGIAMVALLCGLIAGSYPSLYLSSFKPVAVLKGLKMKAGSATYIRKGLVVLQFTVSAVFIICTIIIYQQIKHVQNRQLGFNKNNLIEVNAQTDIGGKYSAIKQELLHTGLIKDAALADHSMIYGGNSSDNITWKGKAADSKILISQRTITYNFFSTTGMQLAEGRGFNPGQGDSQNVVITKSLEALMGNGSALGKIIDASSWDKPVLHVVGIVNDYVYGDVYSKPDPVIFFCSRYGNMLYVRPKANTKPQQALAAIESVMRKNNAEYPFDYRFVDEQFNDMFANEILTSKLASIFAVLAIIISCLGLFGLAAYTAERRVKEIGIRKVLGASVQGLAGLLSKEFIQLVAISCIIAFPVAWWVMHSWLQNYEYKTTMHWWVFALAGVSAIVIALVTVSFQTVKAAMMNPVKAIRVDS